MKRSPQGARIPKLTALAVPDQAADDKRATWASHARMEFASLLIRRLAASSQHIAVVDEHGRAALVPCNERLFDLISKDHPIIGVYTAGARVRDVMEDLEAAGL